MEAECDVIQRNLIEETVTEMVKHIASSVQKDTAIEKKTILVKYKHDFQRKKLAAYFKQYDNFYDQTSKNLASLNFVTVFNNRTP